MAFQETDVRRAIQERDKEFLVAHYNEIKKKLNCLPYLKENDLFDLIGTDVGNLNRNFPAEVYLPTVLNGEPRRKCCAVR